jgi:hypothetical protein
VSYPTEFPLVFSSRLLPNRLGRSVERCSWRGGNGMCLLAGVEGNGSGWLLPAARLLLLRNGACAATELGGDHYPPEAEVTGPTAVLTGNTNSRLRVYLHTANGSIESPWYFIFSCRIVSNARRFRGITLIFYRDGTVLILCRRVWHHVWYRKTRRILRRFM